jgi:hypothetical protein
MTKAYSPKPGSWADYQNSFYRDDFGEFKGRVLTEDEAENIGSIFGLKFSHPIHKIVAEFWIIDGTIKRYIAIERSTCEILAESGLVINP